MLTKTECEAALQAAADAIAQGPLPEHPQGFVTRLWTDIHDRAPPGLQAGIEARLMDFCARLGLLDPGHHEGPWPETFSYPTELPCIPENA